MELIAALVLVSLAFLALEVWLNLRGKIDVYPMPDVLVKVVTVAVVWLRDAWRVRDKMASAPELQQAA